MKTISLICGNSRYECRDFQVVAYRDDYVSLEDFKDCFFVEGLTVMGYLACAAFYVRNQDYSGAFNNSIEVCDMLNYFLQLKNDGYSESEALSLVAALYPEHFKYLAKFGYQSPPEEGGAVDAK